MFDRSCQNQLATEPKDTVVAAKDQTDKLASALNLYLVLWVELGHFWHLGCYPFLFNTCVVKIYAGVGTGNARYNNIWNNTAI